MEMLDHADYGVWLHFSDLPPYGGRGKVHLNITLYCNCRRRKSNLGHLRNKQERYPLLLCSMLENICDILEVETTHSDIVVVGSKPALAQNNIHSCRMLIVIMIHF